MKIAFSPSVYEHAARWVDRSPWEVSRDPDLLFEGHRRAFLAYGHSPILVGIDIYNLEAEAYGAQVRRPDGQGIPAIAVPLYATVDEAMGRPAYDPATDGRIAMVIGVAARLARALPQADVRVPVAGPFSIAVNLRGITGLCEDLALESAKVARWLLELAENQAAFCRAIVAAGLDVAFFESAAAPPLMSPRQFHDLELPALRRVVALAAAIAGHPVPCIMGGDTLPIVDDLLSTGTGFLVCNVETDQAQFVRRVSHTHPQVRIRVNMDPAIVAGSDTDAIRQEVDRILALTAEYPNCLMGTGCLPLETPPDNVRRIAAYVA